MRPSFQGPVPWVLAALSAAVFLLGLAFLVLSARVIALVEHTDRRLQALESAGTAKPSNLHTRPPQQ